MSGRVCALSSSVPTRLPDESEEMEDEDAENLLRTPGCEERGTERDRLRLVALADSVNEGEWALLVSDISSLPCPFIIRRGQEVDHRQVGGKWTNK